MDRQCSHGSGWAYGALLLGMLLVFISVLCQIGTGPVYLFRQFEMREAMERRILRGLPDEALSVLRFSNARFDEVELFDDGQEFELEEVMYDIVSIERIAGTVVVRAVRDGDETRLNTELERMVRANEANDQRSGQERSVAVCGWVPFCEAWQRLALGGQPLTAERLFGPVRAVTGRDRKAIDPGPPRV